MSTPPARLSLKQQRRLHRVKDTLKKRCWAELKRRRQANIDAHRQMDDATLVQQVMQQEFAAYQQSQDMSRKLADPSSSSSSLPSSSSSATQDNEQEDLIELWDAIARELMMEETRQLLEMDDAAAEVAEQELQLAEQQTMQTVQAADDSGVVCPVCLRSCLRQRRCVIWCECGLTLNTQHDSMTLHDFSCMLHQMIQSHAATGCAGELQWSKMAAAMQPSVHVLVAQCPTCRAYELL
ncbi:hypothetical protein PTSG_09666 [Salpingoeca rosetta]|uniref:RPA-interacting protein C-terminal domain-containing protein n=1 Tax=Salpingoeca rosetta (strain ATCC 50818 / BSB-021) TaxID=946362 RepID=F2ULN0_SALR5|nr:uncharacterized protein PTSG_09666 [Salpingoeca rosetta]EGD78029.1 hypothetical protein PTSG_09666 [Salpingoeca rosetta]|eukprot:XP_004990091.1 hypothetical protein PTSG_09666 [Salpingoeca rosetta]